MNGHMTRARATRGTRDARGELFPRVACLQTHARVRVFCRFSSNCLLYGNQPCLHFILNRCKESKHVQEVALSLTEPRTCEYVLTVRN